MSSRRLSRSQKHIAPHGNTGNHPTGAGSTIITRSRARVPHLESLMVAKKVDQSRMDWPSDLTEGHAHADPIKATPGTPRGVARARGSKRAREPTTPSYGTRSDTEMNESRQDPQINNQGPSVDKCERHMTRRAYQNNNEIESERRGSHIQTHQDAGNENGCLTATTPIPGEERGARHRPKRVPMSAPDPCTQDQDKIRTNEEARASRKEPGTDFIPPFGAGTNPGARESRDETGATRERSPMSKDRDPHGEGVEYASMIVPWDWGGKSSEEIAVAPSSSFILERSSIKADSLSVLPLPGEAKPDEIEKGQGQGERLRGAYDTGLEKGGKSISSII